MDKNEMMIMAVSLNNLFSGDHFEGFSPKQVIDFENRILNSFQWMKRGIAEKNYDFKQPIGYAVIINPQAKKVYAYRRASDENYDDERLRGKWSWGVGGHINQPDHSDKEDNPIHVSLLRELEEEVEFVNFTYISPKVLGYVNSEKDDISRVHLGVLYVIETDAEQVKPKDKESTKGSFMILEELKEILANPDCIVEEWSKIAYEALLEIFR